MPDKISDVWDQSFELGGLELAVEVLELEQQCSVWRV